MPPGQRVPTLSAKPSPLPPLDPEADAQLLTSGELEVVGRLVDASNATLYAHLVTGSGPTAVVYKPRPGERPLRDFPDGTLHLREVAAYRLSELGGWHVVPTTVLREGPFGAGSVQRWVGPSPGEAVIVGAGVVDVVPVGEEPQGWLDVMRAVGSDGEDVTLCHADDSRLAAMAVFDVVANNADRKGGHVLDAGAGRLAGVDHGLTFHALPKLRTVLWGWAGRPLPEGQLAAVQRVVDALREGAGHELLAPLLTPEELTALEARATGLLETGVFPRPARLGAGHPVARVLTADRVIP